MLRSDAPPCRVLRLRSQTVCALSCVHAHSVPQALRKAEEELKAAHAKAQAMTAAAQKQCQETIAREAKRSRAQRDKYDQDARDLLRDLSQVCAYVPRTRAPRHRALAARRCSPRARRRITRAATATAAAALA